MRILMVTCGVLCVLFGVFHGLFWPLMGWPGSLAYMEADDRMLMQTFNFCMTPVFFVLAWAYLRQPKAMLESALGRTLGMIPVVIFAFRALAEPLFGDLRQGESWFFLVLCLAMAALFAVPLRGARKA